MTIYIVEELINDDGWLSLAFPDMGKALEYAISHFDRVFMEDLVLDGFVTASFTSEITPVKKSKLDMGDNFNGIVYRLPVSQPTRIMNWQYQDSKFQYRLNIIKAEVEPEDWEEYYKAAQKYYSVIEQLYGI